ncbi:branched-chain amino acid aminotransferase [Zunongwangia sp.]|uniref:branched-chain amino acid aminotransferase n=1 Tax=Zunongwangia sp. TaxID=1965325 RepID=UPI003AA7B2C3
MENIKQNLQITKVKQSKLATTDLSKLSFGQTFTDHMFVCDYKDGSWQTPQILPYGPLQLDPSAKVFHYGQAVFEGMKAYKDENDKVWLFRPDENFNRINKSSKRLAIPEFPEDFFFDGLKELMQLEKDWIQKGMGNSLYIRPFVISTEAGVSASPASEYRFMIICSPAQAYYSGEVRVKISEDYSRSADGGIGFAKAAGNYAGQFYPTDLAKEEGYQQVIWTDSNSHEYLEEAGTMNVFFRIGDKLITAPTSDRILDGVTRKSILELAKNENVEVEVRKIKVSELTEAAKAGTLKEIFGSGTAAVVTPILGFGYKGEKFELPTIDDSYGKRFKQQLLNIQYNIAEDKFNWRYAID